ncbi:MAG: TIGR00730 family Rossman fold protein [Myxococcota bacterium]
MATQKLSLCVFCGARDGGDPAYGECAEELGRAIAMRGWRLVYGAGNVGLMGRVARSTQEAGGETLGVIPEHLLGHESGKRDLTTFIVTETMHERKKVMFMNADAIAVLPGGAGSLDEFFEVLTWRQLGLHNKPIFVINAGGYWTPLKTLLTHVCDSSFADRSLLEMATFVDSVDALMQDFPSASAR